MKTDSKYVNTRSSRFKLQCGECDRVHVVHAGSSQQTGAPGEVHTCPYCGFTGTIPEEPPK